MSKIPKGPYSVDLEYDISVFEIRDVHGIRIAVTSSCDLDEAHAAANLFAASWDLRKVLDELAAATAQELGIDWKQSSMGIRTYAALAKARGES